LSIVYSDLYKQIKTDYAIVWADDMLITKNTDTLLRHFSDPNIHLVALPMIDDISDAPSITAHWPTDKFGCAMWNTPTGRCAHHSITRVEHFKKFGEVCGNGAPNDVIDNFCHRHTTPAQRVWPDDGDYVLHTRVDDSTRINTIFAKDKFRIPLKKRAAMGSNYISSDEREEAINAETKRDNREQ